MISGLAHVCFHVSDLDQAIDFYQNKLGLTPAFDFIDDQGNKYGQYLYLGERTFIEIFQGQLAERAEGQPFRHICLEVDDIHKTVDELKAKGLEVTEIKTGKDHSYQAWITDPDGNRIELHHYTPESKQTPWVK